jgi:hypothetical protein
VKHVNNRIEVKSMEGVLLSYVKFNNNIDRDIFVMIQKEYQVMEIP